MLLSILAAPSYALDCSHTRTQHEVNECASIEKQKAEKELDIVYKKLEEKIRPENQKKLSEAHAAWKEYSDKQCLFDTLGTQGGTIHVSVLLNCETRYIIQYKKDLEYQLNCVEGDLDCGGQ